MAAAIVPGLVERGFLEPAGDPAGNNSTGPDAP
jgi:hypothetical protein